MDSTKLSDFLQLLASIGVLVGLLIVAYELRQNKLFAQAEYSQESYDKWMQVASMEMETDIGEIFIRSIEDPVSLSKPDKFKLNAWLTQTITTYDNGDRALELGLATPAAVLPDEDVRYYFASAYSRQWFEANRYWIRPNIAETISRVIETTPPSTVWDPVRNYSRIADRE